MCIRDRHTTTYFRKTFNVDASNVTSVNLDVLRDDGIVVYLNGQEIGRDNLSGDVNYQTFADSRIGGSAETTPVSFTIPASLLLSGENTLAVEVHQATPGSSDLTFDAQLSVTQAATPDDSIVLDATTTILARTFSDGEWSALSQETFVIPGLQSDLRISEIHYNPADPTAAEIAAGFDDNDDFEFIEIFNPSTVGSVNLAGLQLAGGVDFDFGDFELFPGQRVVVVEDVDAFRFRYGDGPTVLGQWSGGLSNGGEELILLDSLGGEVVSVDYGDEGLWPVAADGRGASLVLIDDAQTPASEVGKHYRWAASTTFNGTPGEASVAPQGVVINEVLAHTDAPQSDAIELFNTTAQAIDISGWFLSDSGESPFKFRVPDGTVIAAGGYVSFDESDFNPTPLNPGPNDFALSSTGDQVYLTRDDGGQPVFEDVVDFGATFNGESLGRLPSSAGRLGRLAEPSLGAENGAPAVSDVVLSEFSYHPSEPASEALAIDPTLTENDLEFVEILNASNATIDLGDFRLRGESDVDFAPGTTLAAASTVTVVTFDPNADPTKAEAFRAHYGLDASVRLLGAEASNLNNSFGRISLQQADGPDPDDPTTSVFVAIDEVVYDDLAPFENADGNGLSLNRITAEAFGDDPASWIAALPTPGSTDLVTAAATVVGRFTFYNQSFFDGNSAGLNAADDNALASDKIALLPGQTATFANYTSYTRGINGLFVDIANLADPASLSASDFVFATGNASNAAAFTEIDVTPTLSVRAGAGENGADRISIALPNQTAEGQWLQVTVRANANTGLINDDVFYFGNAPGESGNSAANAQVNTTDEIGARNNPHNFLNRAAVDDVYDFDRNSFVNTTDQIIARNNATNFLTDLNLITAPAPVATLTAAAVTAIEAPAAALTAAAGTTATSLEGATARQMQAVASYVQWQQALAPAEDDDEDGPDEETLDLAVSSIFR